jgi:hypothetical protein
VKGGEVDLGKRGEVVSVENLRFDVIINIIKIFKF